MIGLATLLAAPLLASSSLATPAKGQGEIAIGGGYRLAPTGSLAVDAAKAGDRLLERGGRAPVGTAFFGYHLDGELVLAIELGLTRDSLLLASGDRPSWSTFTVQLAGQREFHPLPWLSPYLGGGFGYYLNAVKRTAAGAPAYQETNTTGFFAALGLRVAMFGPVGAYLEDRYAFASFPIAGVGWAPAGGNTIAAGLYVSMEQDEPRRP